MNWLPWNDSTWVLEARDGEIVDEIQKSLSGFYHLDSTKKKYTSLEAAQKARTKEDAKKAREKKA